MNTRANWAIRVKSPNQIAGFSLLEVLVAFMILTLVIGIVMQIFSGGLRQVGLSSEFQRATQLGQGKLASFGLESPPREGESQGEFDSQYRWHLKARKFVEPDQPAPPTELPVYLMEIELKVMWGDAPSPHTVNFKTLRLLNRS